MDSIPNRFTYKQQRSADKFWLKVGPPNSLGCREWTAHRSVCNGYGWCAYAISMQLDGHYHNYAHRTAWLFTYGAIPTGKQVLHKCDNPPCCEPSHLYLGDPNQNAKDRDARGRGRKTRRRLSDSERTAVIAAYLEGKKLREIRLQAKLSWFGVNAIIRKAGLPKRSPRSGNFAGGSQSGEPSQQ